VRRLGGPRLTLERRKDLVSVMANQLSQHERDQAKEGESEGGYEHRDILPFCAEQSENDRVPNARANTVIGTMFFKCSKTVKQFRSPSVLFSLNCLN
jgi:hypothetical protein